MPEAAAAATNQQARAAVGSQPVHHSHAAVHDGERDNL
jgi:hypothetical protein